MIAGTKIDIGGTEYLIPPINFKAIKKHRAFFSRALRGEINATQAGIEDLEAMFDIVYLAIRRNYPDFSEDALAEALDFAQLPQVFEAVLRIAGFGRGAGAGEA